MMMESERNSKMGPGSDQLLFLSDFNQFPEGSRYSRSPDEGSEIDSDVEGAIYAQMYFQDSFETGKQSRTSALAGGRGPAPAHEAKTETASGSPDWSNDPFRISLLFSDMISEAAGKSGRKRRKKKKHKSADGRESAAKKRKKSKNKPLAASETTATGARAAVKEDPESPLVAALVVGGGGSGDKAVRRSGKILSDGGFQDSIRSAGPDFEEESRCNAVTKNPVLQRFIKTGTGTRSDTRDTNREEKSRGKPLPNEVANHDVIDTELYVLDEANIHGGLYATEGAKNPTEDELMSSSEDEIPLLRLAAEQSKLVKPVAPAEDSEGLPSDEEDSSDDGDGDSGSSSDGSEEGEVCSSDMDLCSEKDDGSAEDKDLWHIIQKDLMGREAYDQMMGLGGYQLKSKKCMNCKQKGHMARACPHPKRLQTCYLCGGLNHISFSCPKDLCCYCYNRKHRGRTCHALGVQCGRCYIDGHHSSMCPDQWRQFHNTTHASSSLVRTHPREQRQNERVFCYNCAERGHFGFECTRSRPRGWAPSLLTLIATYDAEWPARDGWSHHLKRGASFADAEPPSKRERTLAAVALKREAKKEQQRRNSMPLQSSSSAQDSYDPRPQSLLGQPRRGLLPSPSLPHHPLQTRSPHSSDLDSPLFDRSPMFPRDHGLLGSPPYAYPRDPHAPHPHSSSHHTPRNHRAPYSSTPRHPDVSGEGAEYDFPRTPLPHPRQPPPHQALSDLQGHRGRRYSNHDFTSDSVDRLQLPAHPNSDPLPPIRHGLSYHESSSQSPRLPPAFNRRFSDISDARSSLAQYGPGTEPSHKRFQTHNGQLYSERGFRGSEQTARLVVTSLSHDIAQRRVSYRF